MVPSRRDHIVGKYIRKGELKGVVYLPTGELNKGIYKQVLIYLLPLYMEVLSLFTLLYSPKERIGRARKRVYLVDYLERRTSQEN